MDSNEKKPANPQPSLRRRHFLLAGVVGSAGAAAVIVTGKPTATVQQLVPGADDKGKGYAATEHVRNYYRTTRI